MNGQLSQARQQPVEELTLALNEFHAILSDAQRRDLAAIRTVPDADSILVFTAQLDSANRSRRGGSVGSRVSKVLQSTWDFCTVIDTFVSAHPDIAALVWGSVRLTMQIIVNYTSYYKAVSSLFMKLGHFCPLFADYGTLFPSSERLQKSLKNFHASIVRCCKHVIVAIQRPWHSQVFHTFYTSFEQEFQSDIDDIRRCSDDVKDAVSYTKLCVDAQEQKFQNNERAAASESRNLFNSFASCTGDDHEKLRALLVQREERETYDRRQQLLDALCTYRPERLLKQNQRKRYRDTASWIFDTTEFREWIDTASPSVLWCSGKIGSGKTVVTASVIDHLLIEKGRSNCLVSYFFITSSDRDSLSAETVMSSILRQRLPPSTELSQELEERLQRLNNEHELDEIVQFIYDITHTSRSYIIIDGLDECENPNRDKLLKALSSLVTRASNTRLFLASHESLSGEMQKHFSSISMAQISMGVSAVHDDIFTYIDGILQEKIKSQELVVGDPDLITEIKEALIQGADGMFLWVFFQVPEICDQSCDEDIRQCIANLPADLEETFSRVLHRIASRGHNKSKLARKALPWIAASARPLSLEELREAIAVEIGQPYFIPERLCNDANAIISSCENLVHVDEEDHSVQFAHHTIKTFLVRRPNLLQPPPGHSHDMQGFYVDLEEADHFIGEICVTYLNFNDFKTTLSRRSGPLTLPDPHDIARTELGPRSKVASTPGRRSRQSESSKSVEVSRIIQSSTNAFKSSSDAMHNAHPFLKYASTHWLFHTKGFRDDKSKTWTLWRNIIFDGHELAIKPWQSDANADNLDLQWALKTNHSALICLILSSPSLPLTKIIGIFDEAVDENNIPLIDAVVRVRNVPLLADYIFQVAMRYDRLDWLDRSLEAGADPNASAHRTNLFLNPLQSAAQVGHFAIVQRLIDAGADVNAPPCTPLGRTALQAASEYGHLAIFKRLFEAGADVNAPPAESNGRTALQAAARGGHLEVVELLLRAGAHINDIPAVIYGRTALQAAAQGGNLKVVERLLIAGADINDLPGRFHGRTALQAAAERGHLEVVELLLRAGADINDLPGHSHGRTALQAAAQGGHLEVVELLLRAGAHVNDCPAKINGRTALQAAAERGHAGMVKRLLEAGAHVNAFPALDGGQTALEAASEYGHIEIVDILLEAGAYVNAFASDVHGPTVLRTNVINDHLIIFETVVAAGKVYTFTYCKTACSSQGWKMDVDEELKWAQKDIDRLKKRKRGRTALQAATRGGHWHVVERLRRAGAK